MNLEQRHRLMGYLFALGMLAILWYNMKDRYEYAQPFFLYLLWLLPLYAVFRVLKPAAHLRWKQSSLIHYRENSLFKWLRFVPVSFRMIALGAMIMALARPQSSRSFENIKKEGIDIVLSLDCSVSMLSKDFRPNRLESSKKVAESFVMDRPDDRIGLVVYEGESYTQVPLTTDHRVVIEALRSLKSGQIEGGTAIGHGLATAVNRLKNSTAKSKVIVLLTDGVNNRGQIKPLDAARIAKAYGIRVYTIGMGSKGRAESPVSIDARGRYQFAMVEVEIDESTLEEIAELTSGQYFRATDEKKLGAIYEEIDRLEKTKFNVTQYSQRSERFSGLLLLALTLLMAEFALRQTLIRF